MKLLSGLCVFMLFATLTYGQPISGTKTIPGDYATIAYAISQLNSLGTTAPGVTFNIASGYTETIGASLTLNTNTSSVTAPVVFRKVPGGALNPKLFANSGIWNNTTDGGIIIAGSDYVTFDGIDITSTDNTINWGYALVKRSNTAPFDGCQYVTIRNCTITLSQLNDVSYGIYSGNHIATSTTALTITAVADACNNCKFYNNTLSNVSHGIYLNGYNAPAPYTLYDQGNEIGVGGANIITSFGGSYNDTGIGATYQNGISISNNSISSGLNAISSLSVYGISLTGGIQSNAAISNNTLNFSLSANGGSSGVYCIYTQFGNSGTGNVLTISNNTIQSCTCINHTSASCYGIYNNLVNNGPGTINVTNNVIHDITLGGTGYLTGIDAGAALNINISNNTLYNLSQTGSGYINAVRGWTGTTSVHDNVVHDLAITSGSNTLCGLYEYGYPVIESYYNNSFYNFHHNGNGAVYGMLLNTTPGTRQCYSNTIYGFSANGGTVYGMYHGGSTATVYKNKIYDLTSTASSGQVYGIYFYSGSSAFGYNNYISDLKTPASTGTNAVCGIYTFNPNPISLCYNTIYLNAASSSTTTFGSSGIYLNSSYTAELKNNIIINNSIPVFNSAPAYTVAYMRSSTSISNYAATSNNNCFYAGTPGANNLVYFDGTNADQSISLYKARMTPRETLSFSELPPFADAANHNLHILPLVPTQVESSGTRIITPAAIADDYDTDIRWGEAGYPGSGTGTDPGADEGNFTPVSAMAFQAFTTDQVTGNTFSGTTTQSVLRMKISVTGAPSAMNVTQFTCNASGTTAITDINATPSKIYFTGNSPVYGPGLLFGSTTATLANYTISGSQVLTPGDNYFWLVADVIQTAQTGHLIDGQCLSATIGGVAKVPSVTSPAGNLSILGPMSGTYLVGAGNVSPNFATLTDAINHLNHRGAGAAVTLSLTNATGVPYNAAVGEVFPITVGIIPLASSTNTTTIQPAAGVSPVITGSSASSIINLKGTDYFIINGSNAGASRNLTIENTSIANWTAGIQITSLGDLAGATYCTIKNCIIRGGSPGATSSYTYALSSGSGVGSTGSDNDFMTIDNNEFSRAYFGLYIGANTSGVQDNLTVTGNTIGSDNPALYIGNTGAWLSNSQCTFSNNVIKGVISSAISTWGLYIGPGVKNALFSKNDIHSIKGTANSNGGSGLVVDLASPGNNVTIANNLIYDITGDGSSNLGSYGITGMKILGFSTNVKIYYNSVSISGNINRSGATSDASAAIYIGSSATQLDIRNNIFSNSIENITGDSKAYAMYCSGTATPFTTLDYNDYRVSGYEGVLASYNGTDKTTLAAWQAASVKDANSISVDPNFNSQSVLIPYPGSIVLDRCPLLTVTDDFNGAARTAPTSMGAYEPGNDVTPPVVTYIPFYNTHSLTARTLTVTIKDYYTTVPTAGPGLPRLYWRINGNPYSVVTGVWLSGNTYQFTFGNWVALGNTVSYFIVCQDDMGTPNTGATPNSGASGFTSNPPACATPPASPSSYTIVAALSGVKNIPGDYPNITGASGLFADINKKSLSGNLTVNIVGNTTEDGANALNEINTEDPSYHLTIQNSGAYHKISGPYTGALIRFNGADNVTLNGKGRLLINNTNLYTSVAIGFSGGCNGNVIDSCALTTGMNSYSYNYGLYFTGQGNNNIIRGDSIFKANWGLYMNSTYWGLGSGNIITGNVIGSATVSNYIYEHGMYILYQDNLQISKNQVFNIISNLNPMGIYAEAITNSLIEKNDIHDVVYNGSSYGGSSAITFKSLSASPNVMIRNNFIRHMSGMGYSPNAGDNNNIPAGIKLFGSATSGISVYNNSVYLTRDAINGIFFNNEWFTALEIGSGISGVTLKNNILQNSIGEDTGASLTSWGYSVYCKVAVSPFASIDNNLYFTSNFDNNFVGLNAVVTPPVSSMNLASWRTFTGQDAQSQFADPLYTSVTNLIPQAGSPAIGAGLPCPGIVDDDIAGHPRGSSTTIGAWEMVPALTKTLTINLLLQGLFNGGGTMKAAWDNTGPHWGASIADHISIELHDATPGNYATIIYTAADVVLGTSGVASAFIPAGYSGTYYITIRHRNGLPTVSATPVSFAGVSISYSFDAPAKAFGNKLVLLPGGGYGIYSGDINQDGQINNSDMFLNGTGSNGFASGYVSADVNGDGTVDSADMTIVDNNRAAGITASTP
ncbi:MAG: right-handed parallel beta-helix repeat-containing protein [Bacteroidetes bacterium]|nr:right-handed parallel beta-helix repeat-containing protein [Bacteroidota bacterium]